MEKEIKVVVPEGYEIDKENSTFECIKFKPVKQKFVYIDLGLPSGTLWATCNVGAKNMSDFGDYLTFSEAYKKYELPKMWQFDELIEECTWKWDKFDEIFGYYVIGPNGNSIFLPATGIQDNDTSLHGSYGSYWSRTLYSMGPNRAWGLYFINDKVSMSSLYRCYGRNVRPILNRKQ